MAALYDVPAPAKLNLFLHVVGRRPDGYHLLETVFRFIDLQDTLHFERTDDGLVVREGDGMGSLAESEDLVLRAAHALRKATGTSHGARIRYEKRIPVGGGLGGGSSDAATTLIALNRLWRTALTRGELMRLALTLGADVPVFVFGRAAFAQGVGEHLTAVDLPAQTYLLVRPRIHSSTAEIFRSPDLTRNTESVKIPVFADWQQGHESLLGRNDLEAVVLRQHPGIARILAVMREAGLEGRMTGSGSCVFSVLPDAPDGRMRTDQIIGKIHGLQDVEIEGSWVCRGLDDHPLRAWIAD